MKRETRPVTYDSRVTPCSRATHASFGNIQVFDESRQVLKLAANCGFDRPFLDSFATVADERGASCGAALKAARRVIVADVRESRSRVSWIPPKTEAGMLI